MRERAVIGDLGALLGADGEALLLLGRRRLGRAAEDHDGEDRLRLEERDVLGALAALDRVVQAHDLRAQLGLHDAAGRRERGILAREGQHHALLDCGLAEDAQASVR